MRVAVAGAGDEVVAAIGAYEEEMRDYGFAAVEASRTVAWRKRTRWFS